MPAPIRRVRRLRDGAFAPLVLVFVAWGGVAAALADSITGLSRTVVANGATIGEVRLHVGTHDFQPDGNEGIGRATPGGEASGFYPTGGRTLQQTAAVARQHHFGWLQIVTEQPASHNFWFGATPHADPSSDPDNPWPHDQHPWYLNESDQGTAPTPAINPTFDLPAVTSSVLPFQDFPSGFANAGESIGFDSFLVSIKDVGQRTYEVLTGFRWRLTYERQAGDAAARLHVTQLESLDANLSAEYQDIVASYGGTGWRMVPEPASMLLLLVAAAVAGKRSRAAG